MSPAARPARRRTTHDQRQRQQQAQQGGRGAAQAKADAVVMASSMFGPGWRTPPARWRSKSARWTRAWAGLSWFSNNQCALAPGFPAWPTSDARQSARFRRLCGKQRYSAPAPGRRWCRTRTSPVVNRHIRRREADIALDDLALGFSPGSGQNNRGFRRGCGAPYWTRWAAGWRPSA